MMKRWLVVLLGLLLSACVTVAQPYPQNKMGFPPPPYPQFHSHYRYEDMSKEDIEETMHNAIRYLQLLDQYIENIHETYLHVPYLSYTDRYHACRPEIFIQPIEILPALKIKDDGRQSDDELISTLARRVKLLSLKIEEHNHRVEELTRDYRQYCMPSYSETK